MNISPSKIFIAFVLFASGAFAQTANRPTAILVDQIGGRPLPLRNTARSVSAPDSTAAIAPTEQRAFELMNAERQVVGLSMLAWSDEAAALARQHAQTMANGNFFSHRGTDGETVDGRAAKMGVKWLAIGENIATMKGYADPASKALETWMNSAPHKRNILNGMYNQSAIGAAIAADGTIYFTQVFLSR